MIDLQWAQSALHDPDAITNYLELNAPDAGLRLVQTIDERVAQAREHPLIGEFVPEIGLRKLPLRRFPYLLLYDVQPTGIMIVRVRHAAENWR